MEGASPTSPPSGGGEISPPTPAFPVSPQTPYSNPCKCCGSGRWRDLVGGSRQATNLARVRQLWAPDTHHHVNHSSSPSSSLLHIPPLHAAISILLPSASHARHPPVGFFPPSTLWMRSQGRIRTEAGSKRQHPLTPSQYCISPSFLPAWQEGRQGCGSRRAKGRQEGLKTRRWLGADPYTLCYFLLTVSRAEGEKGCETPALCTQLVSAPLARHAFFLTNPDCTVMVGLCGLGLCDHLE